MNLYEAIKPVRVKEQEDKESWIDRWANYSPKGFLATIFLGYLAALGGVIGWCLSTGI
jgi:hypothetical protein